MTGLVYVLSPPEAVEQFRQIVRTVVEQEGQLTPELQRGLNERAEELDVHPVDRDSVLQEVMALPEVRRVIDRKRFAKNGEQDTGIGQTAALQLPGAEPVVVNPPPWKQRWDPFSRLSHQLACTLFFAPLFVLFLGLGLGLVIDRGHFLFFTLMAGLFLTWAIRAFASRGSFGRAVGVSLEGVTGIAVGLVLAGLVIEGFKINTVLAIDVLIALTTSFVAMGIGAFALEETRGFDDFQVGLYFLLAIGFGSWFAVLIALDSEGVFSKIDYVVSSISCCVVKVAWGLFLFSLLIVASLSVMWCLVFLVPVSVELVASKIYDYEERGSGAAFLLIILTCLTWLLLAFVSLGGLTFLRSGSWPLPYWPFGSGG